MEPYCADITDADIRLLQEDIKSVRRMCSQKARTLVWSVDTLSNWTPFLLPVPVFFKL